MRCDFSAFAFQKQCQWEFIGIYVWKTEILILQFYGACFFVHVTAGTDCAHFLNIQRVAVWMGHSYLRSSVLKPSGRRVGNLYVVNCANPSRPRAFMILSAAGCRSKVS